MTKNYSLAKPQNEMIRLRSHPRIILLHAPRKGKQMQALETALVDF